MSLVASGVVAFSNLTQTDVYMGQDTGKYSLTITLDAESAKQLEDEGMRVKQYEGNGQRKFGSKFTTPVVDIDDKPFLGEIPYGSTVRVLYKLGEKNPQWGVGTYLLRVRVVALAEGGEGEQATPEDF